MNSDSAFDNLPRVALGLPIHDLSLVYLRAQMIRTRNGGRLSIVVGAARVPSACPPSSRVKL
jgi:hypothetical protein